jgi:diguanylate cyclase (GGDEF)-like protein
MVFRAVKDYTFLNSPLQTIPGLYPQSTGGYTASFSADLSIRNSNSLRSKSRALTFIGLTALAVVVFLTAAGFLVYRNTESLVASRDAVAHSQDVLYNLQTVTLQLERIDEHEHLYALTHEDDQLRYAQNTVANLNATLLHIQDLVGDNPSQTRHIHELLDTFGHLAHTTNTMTTAPARFQDEMFACRRIVSVMQQEERELLSQRTQSTERRNLSSIAARLLLTALSLLTVLILFGFLVRDAIYRRRSEEQLQETNGRLASTVEALERKMRESNLLTGARDELALCQSSRQAQECAARYLERLLPATSGAICIINNSRQMVELAATWKDPASLLDGFSLDSCCGLRSGRTRWRTPVHSEVHCGHFTGEIPENYLCLPLAAHGDTLGIVYVECKSTGVAAMVDAHIIPLQELVELVSISIASLNLRSKLENQSIRDGLTGMFNRRFMEIALDRELRRAERQKKPVTVMMLDVDHFKKFNDTFGHEAGDMVLREVAETMRLFVRSDDIVCRYGGEEFVIILPELATEAAMERAEVLRRLIGEISLQHRGQTLRQITISIGVAVYPHHGDAPDILLRAADRALYEAKHQGRNRVVLTPTATFA